MKHTIKLLLLATVVVCFAACGTSRKATKGSGTENSGKAEATAEAYKEKVVSNFQTAQYLTARATISLKAGTKDISVGGSLKMKRNDVIQLSLTFLGIEVGRMEFTTTDVLIIDKINKQYVRAPYSQASFLESAGLDFYSLQSLFWNEICLERRPHSAQPDIGTEARLLFPDDNRRGHARPHYYHIEKHSQPAGLSVQIQRFRKVRRKEVPETHKHFIQRRQKGTGTRHAAERSVNELFVGDTHKSIIVLQTALGRRYIG